MLMARAQPAVCLPEARFQHTIGSDSTFIQACREVRGLHPPVSVVAVSASSCHAAVAGPYGQCGGSHLSGQPTSVSPVASVGTSLQFSQGSSPSSGGLDGSGVVVVLGQHQVWHSSQNPLSHRCSSYAGQSINLLNLEAVLLLSTSLLVTPTKLFC